MQKPRCIALKEPHWYEENGRVNMRGGKRAKRWILKTGLPVDVMTGAARVTLFGKSLAMIEGQQGVVEMGASCIRLKTSEGILCIAGSGLQLHELSLDAAMVHGSCIETLTYGRPARESER